jgi:choline/carnitine/betaine transport
MLAVGIGVILVVLGWGVFAEDQLARAASNAMNWVIDNCGWLFVIAADAFLALALGLAVSRRGRIRLGRDDERPEFTTPAWIAMMFSAGMGIGLMFYGVGEPLSHLADPPPGSDATPGSPRAAQFAMDYTLLHWTLHPWAIYAITGLALAYSAYRKGRDTRLSSAFTPLLGARRAAGGVGRAIDLLAVFATVFGSATSLGLGTLQVAAGLDLLGWIRQSRDVELVIVAALTAAFIASAFSGIGRGVKWLSTANALLAAVLMLFVFLVGPTVFVLDVLPSSVGGYLSNLLEMATRTGAFTDPHWLSVWTIFYWAWWLSWAPFVGTFIARISRGRTIREFLVGVLLVPSAASTVWFAVMGGTAIRLTTTGKVNLLASVGDGAQAALFDMLRALPLATAASVLAMVLVALYFITGADSASIVLASITSRGTPAPDRRLVVTWGALIGAVVAVLLLVGGLGTLQQATILVALPFVLVMLALCVSLGKELRAEPEPADDRRAVSSGATP